MACDPELVVSGVIVFPLAADSLLSGDVVVVPKVGFRG
jgi:hypothetical protein